MNLPERMKAYEAASQGVLLRRTPVIIRIDGRAFHSYVKRLKLPAFDAGLSAAMVEAALELAGEAQGCRLAYLQSDECSLLLTDSERLESEPWFGNGIQKIASISASIFTLEFNDSMGTGRAVFDARAFNVPPDDVANYFLWRARDCARNSLSTFARQHFSHKRLHGRSAPDMHEMLHLIDKNWATDVPERFRNGVFLAHPDWTENVGVLPKYEAVAAIVAAALAPVEEPAPEAAGRAE